MDQKKMRKEDDDLYSTEYAPASIHNAASELMACGLTHDAYEDICRRLDDHWANVEESPPYNVRESVWGVYFHMYSGGKWNVTSDYLQNKFPGSGWARSSCFKKLLLCADHVAKYIYGEVVNWDYATKPENSTTDSMERAYSIFFDTAPISVDEGENSYNPKYAECIVKLMAVVTLTGFVVQVDLFSGTSADSVIQDTIKVDKKLSELNLFAAADGGFHQSDRTDIPYSKNHIWPEVLRDGQTLDEYKEEAHQKMVFNEGLGFWRARVEHLFSRVRWGRFSIFKNYQGFRSNLTKWVKCSMAAMNIEVLMRHGDKGIYPPITDQKKHQFMGVTERHPIQSARYPYPCDPLTKEEKDEGLRLKAEKKKSKFIIKNAAITPMGVVNVPPSENKVATSDESRVRENKTHQDSKSLYFKLGSPDDGPIPVEVHLPMVETENWSKRGQFISGSVIDKVLEAVMRQHYTKRSVTKFNLVATTYQAASRGIHPSEFQKTYVLPDGSSQTKHILLPAFYKAHWVLFRIDPSDKDRVTIQMFNSYTGYSNTEERALIASVKQVAQEAYKKEVHFSSPPTLQQEENECAVHVINNAMLLMDIDQPYTRGTLHQKAVSLAKEGQKRAADAKEKGSAPTQVTGNKARPYMIDSDVD